MLETLVNTIIAIIGGVLILGLMFVAFVLWTTRDVWIKLAKTIRTSWKRAKADDRTREEILYSIQYFQDHNKPKSVIYWQNELARKYPEDSYHG